MCRNETPARTNVWAALPDADNGSLKSALRELADAGVPEAFDILHVGGHIPGKVDHDS